jgi:hypothetical protein
VLKSLAVAAPTVSAMLTVAPKLSDFVSMIKDALEIRRDLQKDRVVETLPEDPYAPLKRTVAVVSRELEAAPLSQDERDLIVYRVLLALLEEPGEATQFVDALGMCAGERPA